MANKKISDLTAGSALTGAELIEIEQSSSSAKAALNGILKTYLDTLYTPVIVRAEWMADTHAGYGSTATKIPYFTNVNINVDTASAMTVVNNATDGCKVTINTAGVYAVGFWMDESGATHIGVSVNSNQLTTNINLITAAHRRALNTSAGADYMAFVSFTGYLAANDVVRPHANGVAPNSSALCGFSICRVA